MNDPDATKISDRATLISPSGVRPDGVTAAPSGGSTVNLGGHTTLSGLPPSPIPDVELESELGRGGMGVVYKARQIYLDRLVAVKLLLVSGSDGQEFVRRFQREAKILASLSHANIVSCYQAGVTAANNPYLVMEFIDGPTLKSWIEQHGRVPVRRALAITRDLARALDHANQNGIIHRDVKPENVLLAKQPSAIENDPFPFTAKLVDLGLARPSQSAGDMNLTRQGTVMGTPATMAPEQFDDPDHVDFRSDIYGLGCVLYNALVGQPAYAGKTLAQLVTAKVSGPVPQATTAKADIPLAVNELVSSMLARDREARPQSYQQVIDRCDELLGTTSIAIGRQGNRSAWIGVLSLVVILGGAALAWLAMQPPRAPTTPSPAHSAVVPSVPIISPPPEATQEPLLIRDSDWAAEQPLWGLDQSQRLKEWTIGRGVQWTSAEARENAIAGVAGRIMRPLGNLPCRIQGEVHHATGEVKSDKAQIGLILQDGGRIDLTVLNLGSITQSILNCYKAGEEIPYPSYGPVMLPASKPLNFTLIVRSNSFLASVDGNLFTVISLASPPVELYLGAEGQAPVEISNLRTQQVK